jgi:hypothetical protein
MSEISPRYLTTAEAAIYCGRSERTLEKWRLIQAGPAYVKFGRGVVYDIRDLDSFFAAHRIEPTTAGSLKPTTKRPVGRPRKVLRNGPRVNVVPGGEALPAEEGGAI